ncbi:MAG: sugar ABC transporter ATP-binding protein [Armatimonadetes bacterium]|nr:sugar ABC transporter ATP-binding protein [Armatimonadota bacterium]
MTYVLDMQGIVKQFPGVRALDDVSFSVMPGEVHALMGENGAGKSTLIKVMTGVERTDAGRIVLDGREVSFRTPLEAVEAGISTVYQEVNLATNLSVMENVVLGREARGAFGIKWGDARRRAEHALGRLGLDLDVRQNLGGCSIAVRQLVLIARALDVRCKVLVLDEPTSSLDKDEVSQLFGVLRRLKDEGLGIVFVTHFLDQVYQLADRTTVLRNGKVAGTGTVEEIDRRRLVTMMIGRDIPAEARRPSGVAEKGGPLLSAKGLGKKRAVTGVDIDVAAGEVVGLAGLLGSGRTETLNLLFGADRSDSGSVRIRGRAAKPGVRRSVRAGIGLCPEDRKDQAVFAGLSVRENMLVVLQGRRGWWRKIGAREGRAAVDRYFRDLDVSAPNPDVRIENLSGGNQQKVVLSRWLASDPAVLLLDEPTRGIDVGTKFEIAGLVERLRGHGMGFVFVSSELEEVLRSCTKVCVFRDRAMVGELSGASLNEQSVQSMIAEAPR